MLKCKVNLNSNSRKEESTNFKILILKSGYSFLNEKFGMYLNGSYQKNLPNTVEEWSLEIYLLRITSLTVL